jgi:hypothetical protein
MRYELPASSSQQSIMRRIDRWSCEPFHNQPTSLSRSINSCVYGYPQEPPRGRCANGKSGTIHCGRDGANDISNYRLDVLYGVKMIDNRLACRISGGSGTLGDPAQ